MLEVKSEIPKIEIIEKVKIWSNGGCIPRSFKKNLKKIVRNKNKIKTLISLIYLSKKIVANKKIKRKKLTTFTKFLNLK